MGVTKWRNAEVKESDLDLLQGEKNIIGAQKGEEI